MIDRTMIVVAGGSSTRFGADKLTAEIAGKLLLDHTLEAVADHVDQVVLVVRESLIPNFERPGMITVPGGENRTASEIAGLAATPPSALIGIHDGARPAVPAALIEEIFRAAAVDGGAVPGLEVDGSDVDNQITHPTKGALRVQTPQVFWGPELKSAFYAAEREGYEGRDTMEVVQRFSNLEVAVVPGAPENIKVTFPEDLERVAELLGQ